MPAARKPIPPQYTPEERHALIIEGKIDHPACFSCGQVAIWFGRTLGGSFAYRCSTCLRDMMRYRQQVRIAWERLP